MKIAFISGLGCSTSWAARLLDEQHDVRMYVAQGEYSGDNILHCGDGIVPKELNYDRLIAWAKEAHERGEPTIVFYDLTGSGEKADAARKAGLHVVGGGTFMDRLEKDRLFGQRVAEKAGCLIPPYKEFSSLSAVADFASELTGPVYFKSDQYFDADGTFPAENGEELLEGIRNLRRAAPDRLKCILQEKIDGVAFSTARWWNGRVWCSPYQGDIEKKKFMNDELGPATGCSTNAVWWMQEEKPDIAEALGWDRLGAIFLKREAPPGLYDINALIDKKGDAYFLEWTSRLGYDCEQTSFRLVDDLGKMLWAVATGQGEADLYSELAYSFRITIPPYPWEVMDYTAKPNPIGVAVSGVDGLWDGHFIPMQVRKNAEGHLECASTDGIIGLSLAVGEKLSELGEETLAFANDELRIKAKQYRTDGAKVVKADAEAIEAAGYSLHAGLLQ